METGETPARPRKRTLLGVTDVNILENLIERHFLGYQRKNVDSTKEEEAKINAAFAEDGKKANYTHLSIFSLEKCQILHNAKK
jgi:hypothetical protein